MSRLQITLFLASLSKISLHLHYLFITYYLYNLKSTSSQIIGLEPWGPRAWVRWSTVARSFCPRLLGQPFTQSLLCPPTPHPPFPNPSVLVVVILVVVILVVEVVLVFVVVVVVVVVAQVLSLPLSRLWWSRPVGGPDQVPKWCWSGWFGPGGGRLTGLASGLTAATN